MESNRITVLSEHQFTVVYDTTQFVFGHKCTCLFILVFVKYEPNPASLSFILATGQCICSYERMTCPVFLYTIN